MYVHTAKSTSRENEVFEVQLMTAKRERETRVSVLAIPSILLTFLIAVVVHTKYTRSRL